MKNLGNIIFQIFEEKDSDINRIYGGAIRSPHHKIRTVNPKESRKYGNYKFSSRSNKSK